MHVIPVEKIEYAQAQDDYVCFRCDGKEYLKEQTLAQVETSLDPAKFVRIHRSFLLNLDRLVRVELDDRDNRIAILDRRPPPAGQPRGLHAAERVAEQLEIAECSLQSVEECLPQIRRIAGKP